MTSFISFLEQREWGGSDAPDAVLTQYFKEAVDMDRAEADQLHIKIMDELIAVLKSHDAPTVVFQDILLSLTAQSIVHEVTNLDQLADAAMYGARSQA